ncbi:MAG TPA: lactate utilization protein [Gemmataceae bacterium]|nr:lactate utilization protein [Gemmataceae bacterium]
MSTSRDAFLQRVRQAVAEGNRAGAAPPLPERGTVGYQGAGPDAVARLRDELTAAGGVLHVVGDEATAAAKVLELVAAKGADRALVGRGAVIDRLGVPDRLRAAGVEVAMGDALPPGAERDTLFAAGVGITGVDYVIAETSSLVVLARPDDPRSLSLLPPVHVAVADRGQLLPDLFDLFASLDGKAMPSGLSVITGPSKTGDIELRLVTGVHGPGEVHLVFIDRPNVA